MNGIASVLFGLTMALRAASGWRRVLFAFAFGSVMALTMPPFGVFPLLWVCLPALIFLLQGCRSKKQAFVTGWSFAFGFLAFSLYWIAASMLVDFKTFWWAIPLSIAVLPACFAIYNGILATIAWCIGLEGVTGAVAFGLMWFLADEARGRAFSGFPWNLLGYSWSRVLPVLQTTSVIGIYGLSLLTCVAASLPASLIDRSKAAYRATVSGVVLFILVAAGGEARLHLTKITDVSGIRLRLVQPDIDQAHKWLISEREVDFEKTLDLTSAPPAPGEPAPTHFIWPETGSTYYLAEDRERRAQIAARIPSASSVLTGIIRRDIDEKGHSRFYNSLVAVDGLGRLVAAYDKVHLVPFGEYMPMRQWLPFPAIAADIGDFTRGDGVRSLRVLGLPPFSPLICYEAIFPDSSVDPTDRPDLIVNVTNDAWYGNTIGPYQHFAIARVRAIEQGLPLARSANTGISGMVDPLGRIVVRLGLGKRGFIDTGLPAPLPPTFFSKWQEIPVYLMFLLTVLALFVIRKQKNIKS
jgi:apolipoprotein N-acyltransferase